jgi:hypothetical protein
MKEKLKEAQMAVASFSQELGALLIQKADLESKLAATEARISEARKLVHNNEGVVHCLTHLMKQETENVNDDT